MNTGISPLGHSPLIAELDPSDIEVGERIGFLHEDKAVALGRLMAVDGQRDPIKVCKQAGAKPWLLVTGLHRLEGARREGIKIWAIEVEAKGEGLVDLEASENLHRRALGPIERAKFTFALVNAAQERIAREHGDLSQQQMAIKARWDRVRHQEEGAEQALNDEASDTCAKIAHVYGWEESVGDAMGMSRRTIHNDLALYRLIIEPFPELCGPLNLHPIVGENASQLKKIAGVENVTARGRVIELLLSQSEINADQAIEQAGIGLATADAAPVAHQKHFNAIEGGWSRLNLDQKRQFVTRIPALLTDGMKRQLRDQLNEELGDA